jgi:type I restriction enzyme R subunit
LQSIQGISSQRFGLYLGQRLGVTGRDFTPAQVEVLRKVAEYIAQNGCTNRKDLFDFDQTLAIQAIQIYTPIKAESELDYLSKFLLQIKAA